MIFASMDEVQLAYSLGVVDTHAMIKVRLPPGRQVKGEHEATPTGAGRDDRRPRDLQRHAAQGDALLQHAPAVFATWPR